MDLMRMFFELERLRSENATVTGVEARRLFLEGILGGMQIAGVPCPLDDESTKRERESWAINQLMIYQDELRRQMKKDAQLVIDSYGLPRNVLRGMLFDTRFLDDSGRELNEDGEIISDYLGRMLPGQIHQPWPYYELTDNLGRKVTQEEFDKLSETEQKRYHKKRRYFEIDGFDRIYSDDTERLRWLIVDDIRHNDRINLRYLIASAGQHELSQFYTSVTQAITESDSFRGDDFIMHELLRYGVQGHFATDGCLNIAFMLIITTLNNEDCMRLKGEDYRWLNSIIQSFLNQTFDKWLSDLDLMTFCDIHTQERLMGAILSCDRHWQLRDIHSCHNNDRLGWRRDYVKHYLLSLVIERLVDTFNDDSFAAKYLFENQSDRQRAILELMETINTVIVRERDANIDIQELVNTHQLAKLDISIALQLIKV